MVAARFLLPQPEREIHVRSVALLAGLASALLFTGCDRAASGAGDSEKRLAALEKQVEIFKEQNRDLRAKIRASHGFRSPLADFFASPEFWQCTYDSSWSDCSSRCSKQTGDGYQACLDNHPEGPEREKCINENTANGSACLKGCPVQTSPIDPTSC
jgi:hypothetical protein